MPPKTDPDASHSQNGPIRYSLSNEDRALLEKILKKYAADFNYLKNLDRGSPEPLSPEGKKR